MEKDEAKQTMVKDFTTNSETEFPDHSVNYSFDYNDEVVICLDINKGRLGCSILDCHTQTLKLLNRDYSLNLPSAPLQSAPNELSGLLDDLYLVIKSLIWECSATLCLLSLRLEENLYSFIKKACAEINCRIELQATNSFKKTDLLNAQSLNDNRSMSLLCGIVESVDNSTEITGSTVRCILTNYKKHAELDDLNTYSSGRTHDISNPILHVESIDLSNVLLIDENTLKSLQILPIFKKTGTDKTIGKRDMSILELLNHVSNGYSKNILKSWLLAPLRKKKEIETRYDVVDIFLGKNNSLFFEEIQEIFKGFPDLFNILKQLQHGNESVTIWTNLVQFLERAIRLTDCLSKLDIVSTSENLIRRIISNVDLTVFKTLLRKVKQTIDFETSKYNKEIVLIEGINERLDQHKLIYNELEVILTEIAKQAENDLFQNLMERNVSPDMTRDKIVNAVYIPQLGYLVTVDSVIQELSDITTQLGWNEVFRTNTDLFYKNEAVLQLDQKYGDIYASISDLEVEVLHSLQECVIKERLKLMEYFQLFAQLEVLVSFAYISQRNGYVRPELSEDECVLDIKSGRHPLYENIVDTYIPNDLELLGGNFDDTSWSREGNKRIGIITGANASGKSVFLIQTGLIVYLAHIGCFVPCDSARIGLVDRILTRTRTQDTVSLLKSSFELDSLQMARCLSQMSKKSLILIDEFGKGTDIIDGPSLFGAIIQQLAESKDCPRVLACTHFHELFNTDVLDEAFPGVNYYMTQVLLNQAHISSSRDTLCKNVGITFLYRIKEGISRQSFGVYCAKICGIKESIVKRAEELTSIRNDGYDVIDYCRRLSKDELTIFQNNQEIIKKFLCWDLDLDYTLTEKELRQKLASILNECGTLENEEYQP